MSKVRSRIQKGRAFQKKIMGMIKKVFDLDEDEIRTPVGCETGADVKLSESAMRKVGLAIECKNQKNLNIWAALEQAKSNCSNGCIEAVVFKRGDLGANKTYICLPLNAYLDLRRALLLYQENEENA